MRIILLIIFALSAVSASSQAGRQNSPLLNLNDGNLKNSGWHFAPGITYMLPGQFNQDYKLLIAPDTLIDGEYKTRGRIGAYLEFGRGHFFDEWIPFDYLDYGIAYKMLRGKESFAGDIKVAETNELLGEVVGDGNFSEHYASVYLNFSKFFQVDDYKFIMASLGFNGDYGFIYSQNDNYPLPLKEQNFAQDIIVQAHAKVGFGFKVEKNLFIIPSLETPILNIMPFEDGKSTLPYFSSRYRPLILSIRFQWLSRKKPEDCVGKPGKKTGHKLWGNDIGKKYR